MKQTICALALILAMAGCAAEQAAPAEPPAAEQPVSVQTPKPEPQTEAAPQAEEAPQAEAMAGPENEELERALSCVGKEVSALYNAIGQPENTHYEYSCSGPGDDGILYYPGFLVFTYKENNVETVVDAEAE